MTLRINGTTVINTDRSITLGTATPGAPVTGMMRYNSTIPDFQVYDGTQWVPFKKVGGGANPTLYSWGSGAAGILASNSVANRSSPGSAVGIYIDWISIKAAEFLGIGLRADGSLWGWGNGGYGGIGENSTVERSSPVAVLGGFTWTNVTAGKYHTLGVRSNGTLWAWGRNSYGQLGNSSVADRSSPVAVAGGFADWVRAGAGPTSSVGVRANGTMWSWGANTNGQLANNLANTASTSSPTIVTGGITDWIDVSVGSGGVPHFLALRANGTIYAWGYSSSGAMGINVIAGRSSPTIIAGGITDWVSLTTGDSHSLAIRANGTMYAWGNNQFGQLGNNSSTGAPPAGISSPVPITGGITDWVKVDAGTGHSVAIRANGTMYAWGSNANGQLGNNLGATASRSSPTLVVGGFTDWIDVATASVTSLGIRG